MNLPYSIRSAPFRRQLTITVALGILCLALLSSLATSWHISRQIHDNQVEQGKLIAENLAKQSALALLYASSDNAAEAINAALAYPNTVMVEVRTAQGKRLAGKNGQNYTPAGMHDSVPAFERHRPVLEQETSDEWHFAAPVIVDDQPSTQFDTSERTGKTIGFVRIVQTKATLTRMVRDVFMVNLGISLFFALVFIVILGLLTGHLVKPLSELSKQMSLAEHGASEVRALVNGPRDISDMARAFNSMMAAQEIREQDLHAAHDHIAQEEAKLRTVADFTYDWEYWQGPSRELLYMTPSCERVTGYSQAEFIANPDLILRIIHPEDRSLMERHLLDMHDHDGSLLTFRIVRRDGEIRWIAHHCRAVSARNGEPMGRRVSNRDETEQKQAEEELRRSEALFKAMTDTSPLAIYMSTGIEQRGEYMNPTFVKLFGYTLEELPTAAQWWPRAYPDETYRQQVAEEWQRRAIHAIETHTTIEPMETIVTCKDGSRKNILWGFTNLGDQNWAFGLDLTERKAAETALLRSNADLEQFAYSISHDMRQPLRMVTGHLQLLERGLKDVLDQENRENLNFALDGARRMDAMIVSLLEYSRVGRKTSSKQWMESRESLDEALAFLAPAIAECRATVSVAGEWPHILASRDEMTRLFQNLIGNAVKYRAPDQAPRIEVTSDATSQLWRVSVRDHGIGIPPQQIDRLFQFFSRLQSRTRYEGTGMGLALCRKIAEHHGGRIWVESAGEGEGSSFIFEFPIGPADNEPARGDSHEIP